MALDTLIAPEPEQEESHGAAANSSSSPSPGKNPIISTESDAESSVPLGTPQERLQILQMEIRNSALAGLPVRYEVRMMAGVPHLIVVIPHVTECDQCKWLQYQEQCQNPRCARSKDRSRSVRAGT